MRRVGHCCLLSPQQVWLGGIGEGLLERDTDKWWTLVGSPQLGIEDSWPELHPMSRGWTRAPMG